MFCAFTCLKILEHVTCGGAKAWHLPEQSSLQQLTEKYSWMWISLNWIHVYPGLHNSWLCSLSKITYNSALNKETFFSSPVLKKNPQDFKKKPLMECRLNGICHLSIFSFVSWISFYRSHIMPHSLSQCFLTVMCVSIFTQWEKSILYVFCLLHSSERVC